ncbi:hypothetical protein CHUAL_012722 [Chamberlinius hualienensis]
MSSQWSVKFSLGKVVLLDASFAIVSWWITMKSFVAFGVLLLLCLTWSVECQFQPQAVPLSQLLATPKRTSAVVYAGQQARPEVQQVQRQAVAVAGVPTLYTVGTPLGPAYGVFNRAAAVPYTYTATQVNYKPVESHGYNIQI